MPTHRMKLVVKDYNFNYQTNILDQYDQSQLQKINECKHYVLNVPYGLRQHLQLDDEARYSLTVGKLAKLQSYIISDCVTECKMNPWRCRITDGTASVGGNVIAFADFFYNINAIELDKNRAQMLLSNVKLLNLSHKVTVWHGDCANTTEVAQNMTQDVLFLDPPWLGPDYKKHAKLSLFLSGKSLRQVCIEWAPRTRIIALKLPINFDYNEFFHESEKLPFSVMYSAVMGDDRAGNACVHLHGDPQTCPVQTPIMNILVLRTRPI